MRKITHRLSLLSIALCLTMAGWAAAPVPIAVSHNVTITGTCINLSEADVKPHPVHMERPVYPAKFRAAGIEGHALTEFVVNTEGVPTQVQIVNATDEEFAEAALEAMRLWRFTVAKKDGVVVPCREQIVIKFDTIHEAGS